MNVEHLLGVLKRLIDENMLRERHGEDTIGVLMKCGAFHCAPVGQEAKGFVVRLAEAIDSADPISAIRRSNQ